MKEERLVKRRVVPEIFLKISCHAISWAPASCAVVFGCSMTSEKSPEPRRSRYDQCFDAPGTLIQFEIHHMP